MSIIRPSVSSGSKKSSQQDKSPPKLLLDREDLTFRTLVSTAVQLIRLIPSKEDQKLAIFWMKKVTSLKTEVPMVKRGRNDFLDYFVNVLRDALYTSALNSSKGRYMTPRARLKLKEEIRNVGAKGCHHPYLLEELFKNRAPAYLSRWSTDGRTYVAMQPIPGRGALIYMAVTENPDDGWELPTSKPPELIDIYLRGL